MKDKRKYYWIKEVAELAGVSIPTIHRWIYEGVLESYQINGRGKHRIDKKEWERFWEK